MSTVTDGSGTIIPEVAAGQYPFTPIPNRQSNVSIASATGLTPPAGATYAIVQVSGTARYTMDGATNPTSSLGFTLSAGQSLALSGPAVIAAFKAIGSGLTMDAEYFK